MKPDEFLYTCYSTVSFSHHSDMNWWSLRWRLIFSVMVYTLIKVLFLMRNRFMLHKIAPKFASIHLISSDENTCRMFLVLSIGPSWNTLVTFSGLPVRAYRRLCRLLLCSWAFIGLCHLYGYASTVLMMVPADEGIFLGSALLLR